MPFLPINVENHAVYRIPWVSIGITAIMLGAFAYTQAEDHKLLAQLSEESDEVWEYWQTYPYLALPEPFYKFIKDRYAKLTQEEKNKILAISAMPPDDDAVIHEREQKLAALCEEAKERVSEEGAMGLFMKWGFIPAEGMLKLPILTSIFLHVGGCT
jgi:hypothetical protein